MSTNQPARRGSGPGRAKSITVAALTLGLAATSLPLVLAAPASATQSKGGCTVTPLRPVYTAPVAPQTRGKVDYPIRVKCSKKRLIEIQQDPYEVDHADADDYLGRKTHRVNFSVTDSTVLHNIQWAPETEAGTEEVLHWLRFRVAPHLGDFGGWSGWEASDVKTGVH